MTRLEDREFPLKELQPPMANGEVIFEEPWQGRVFAMSILLNKAGLFSWDEFQSQLISTIEQWEREGDKSEDYKYYERFSDALNSLLGKKRIVAGEELVERTEEYVNRPHGHDH